MKKLFLVSIFTIFTFNTLFANRMRIAVLDFQADGVSKSNARRISELIRTEMINTGKYIVIERNQMNIILKEQGLQQTGCTDENCAVQVGKLLSAKKILIGTVMKLGKSLIINGRIVDVEKGIAEFGEKQAVTNIDEIFNAVNLFAKNLTKRISEIDETEQITTKDKKIIIKPKEQFNFKKSIKYLQNTQWLSKGTLSSFLGLSSTDIFFDIKFLPNNRLKVTGYKKSDNLNCYPQDAQGLRWRLSKDGYLEINYEYLLFKSQSKIERYYVTEKYRFSSKDSLDGIRSEKKDQQSKSIENKYKVILEKIK